MQGFIGDGFWLEDAIGDGSGHGDGGANYDHELNTCNSHGDSCGCLNMYTDGCDEDGCCNIGEGLALGSDVHSLNKMDAYESIEKKKGDKIWLESNI